MVNGDFHQLMMIYVTYLIITVSPGPSNMSIMAIAMKQGTCSAVIMALGVLCGSMFWALSAATGISALLSAYAETMIVIKMLGGIYLLYLAYKSAKSALRCHPEHVSAWNKLSGQQLFRRGLFMHLTNPKAILAWGSIMSLGLHSDSPSCMFYLILLGCFMIGTIVFLGYALIFSTRHMIKLYQSTRRWTDGGLAILFSYAGIHLLLSKES